MLFDPTISKVMVQSKGYQSYFGLINTVSVARFAKEVRAERVLCLTATATPKVADDICAAFDIEPHGVFRTSTYRPNLRLLAQSFAIAEEKVPALKSFLQEHQGPSIVYVQTHDQTDIVCAFLKKSGINAHGYHAGMTNDLRTVVQEKFMTSDDIVVSTLSCLRIEHTKKVFLLLRSSPP